MTEKISKIINQLQLQNGIEFYIYDQSRLTAGDRWQIELKCEASIPIVSDFWDMISGDEPGIFQDIRNLLADKMTFVTTRQRNFVDAQEYETVLQEMVQQVLDSIVDYLGKPNFPQEFFKKQYREARQKVLISQAMKNNNYNS